MKTYRSKQDILDDPNVPEAAADFAAGFYRVMKKKSWSVAAKEGLWLNRQAVTGYLTRGILKTSDDLIRLSDFFTAAQLGKIQDRVQPGRRVTAAVRAVLKIK